MTAQNDSLRVCVNCRSPKAQLACPLCQEGVCAKCAEHLPQDAFKHKVPRPAELSHLHYCPPCYSQRIEPERESYAETLEKAKQVFVFYTTQRKAIPLVRKSKDTLRITEQEDRDETILTLAFMAVERGFNAIIECEVNAVKVRNEGWQHNVWSGSAIPALIDADKMDRYS